MSDPPRDLLLSEEAEQDVVGVVLLHAESRTRAAERARAGGQHGTARRCTLKCLLRVLRAYLCGRANVGVRRERRGRGPLRRPVVDVVGVRIDAALRIVGHEHAVRRNDLLRELIHVVEASHAGEAEPWQRL